MPRDDTVIHYSSRTFIYRSYFEHFESTNELFFHHKKRAQKRSPNNERKEARKKKKKTNSTTTTTKNVSLDASSVRYPRRERVRGPKRGAVLEPKNLSQSAITSGYVSAHGFKGQLIGLIYAASYLRMPLLAANAIVIFVKVLFG